MPDGGVWVRSRSRILRVRGTASGEDAISFATGGPEGVSVEIRRCPREDTGEFEFLLDATTERRINEGRRAALEALAERRDLERVTAPGRSQSFDEKATPSPAAVPNTVKVFFQETLSVLAAVSRKTVLSLRWRRGLDIPLTGLEYVASEFSFDREHWTAAGLPLHTPGAAH